MLHTDNLCFPLPSDGLHLYVEIAAAFGTMIFIHVLRYYDFHSCSQVMSILKVTLRSLISLLY